MAYAGHYASHYAGPIHIPVIGPHGVPLDTPEVAAGKAANALAHAEAHARNGDHAIIAHGYAAPVAIAHGVPVDTPEVAHAKAAHFAAHAEAASRNLAHGWAHYRKRRGLIAPLGYAHAYPQHIPVIGPHGVPLETPEVVAAKVHHAAAHAEVRARNGYHAAPLAYATHGVVAAPLAYAHGHYANLHHIPVIGHNGVPLDTPEVAAAKAHHAAAHAEARARNGDHLHYY